MIFGGLSKKYLQTLNGEDANISDFAYFAGGEELDVAPTAVVVVAERDAIMQVKYFAVCFPNGNIHRVAAVKHGASGGNVY